MIQLNVWDTWVAFLFGGARGFGACALSRLGFRDQYPPLEGFLGRAQLRGLRVRLTSFPGLGLGLGFAIYHPVRALGLPSSLPDFGL